MTLGDAPIRDEVKNVAAAIGAMLSSAFDLHGQYPTTTVEITGDPRDVVVATITMRWAEEAK